MDYNLLTNYVLCFFAGLGLIFFFFRNLIIEWIKVKRSGGRKLLVKVKNPSGDYFRAGKIDLGALRFKARKRDDNPDPGRLISIPKNYNAAVYKCFGVNCIDVDDLKNCILFWNGEAPEHDENAFNYSAVPGFNAEFHDEIVKTALAKPSLLDGLFSNKIFQLIVICGILLVGVLVYMTMKRLDTVDAHAKMIYDMTEPIYQHIFNGTVVKTTVV